MEGLNERIKNLRKQKGLTQSQLADKIGVTDKAVSKWEVNEANPDISLLLKIADLFEVTIDYLLTGKTMDNISLDEMDEDKRAIYLIKKDDAVTFEKYGYVQKMNFFKGPYEHINKKVKEYFDLMFENKSKKIFELCLNYSLNNIQFNNGYIPLLEILNINPDSYIKMCVDLDCSEGLNFINLKYYAIGQETKNDALYALDYYNKIPTLSEETFKYIFSSKESKKVQNYISKAVYFNKGDKSICPMGDHILTELFERGYFYFLDKTLDDISNCIELVKECCKEKHSRSLIRAIDIIDNGSFYVKNISEYSAGLEFVVFPIKIALKSAINNKNFKYVRKFNEINKKIKEAIETSKINILSDFEIDVMELESDEKKTLEEVMSFKHTYFGVLDINSCLNDNFRITETDEIEILNKKIDRIRKLKSFVKKQFISPYEMLITLTESKKYKELYEFAVDFECEELENAVMNFDDELIKKLASDIFLPSEREFSIFKKRVEDLKAREYDEEYSKSDEAKQKFEKDFYYIYQEENKDFIEEKHLDYHKKANNDVFTKLMTIQMNNAFLAKDTSEWNIDWFKNIKNLICDNCSDKLKAEYEKLTHKKALENEYKKCSNDYNAEYLRALVNEGDIDRVTIYICKRLETIFKYKYEYAGKLYEMINRLYDNLNDVKHINDDEECFIRKQKESLHKIRVKRNNALHINLEDATLTDEEIKNCILVLDLIDR